jgi:hypothetical protein
MGPLLALWDRLCVDILRPRPSSLQAHILYPVSPPTLC